MRYERVFKNVITSYLGDCEGRAARRSLPFHNIIRQNNREQWNIPLRTLHAEPCNQMKHRAAITAR